MEWITGESTNEVDIGQPFFSVYSVQSGVTRFLLFTSMCAGFVPEMRLRSLHPSAVLLNNSQVNTGAGSYNFSAIKWDEEISVDRALVLLEQSFYPFKKVRKCFGLVTLSRSHSHSCTAGQIPYLYFTDAMDLARQQEKLVHFILLWGALDDQSC